MAEDAFIDACLEAASKNLKVDINPEITEEEVRRMLDEYSRQLQMQGMNIDAYYQMTGSTEDDLKKLMEPEATKRVKYRYLIEAIAEAEDLKFTKEEVDKRAHELAQQFGVDVEEINKVYTKDILEYDLKMHKALEILKENN